MSPQAPEWSYLHQFLTPLADVLARQDVTDVYVNRPHEIWIETLGGSIERIDSPSLDSITLERLSRQIAAFAAQGINREHPILSAAMPGGERVQIILPPATRGDVALAVRKHVSSALSLNDYVAAGAFHDVTTGQSERVDIMNSLQGLLNSGAYGELLSTAVRARLNILVSGGTSTGKTTFLNALIAEVPRTERLIFIEDTPELRIDHPNALGLISSRGQLGEAQVTTDDLVTASLRMRPDRIILGELRGPEAYSFLRAVNTGHPGSMTTVHANDPLSAIDQISLLVLQGGSKLSRHDVRDYIRSSIDIFVQLDRVSGRRYVSEVVLADQLQPRAA